MLIRLSVFTGGHNSYFLLSWKSDKQTRNSKV